MIVDYSRSPRPPRRRCRQHLVQLLESRLLLSGGIGGVVYDDLNANGARDAGEPGLRDALVYVDVDGNGAYTNNEPYVPANDAGAYYLTPEHLTSATGPLVTIGSSPPTHYAPFSPLDGLRRVARPGGADVTGVDFGLRERPAATQGRVFYSLSGRTTYSDPQTTPPLAGWTVFFDANDNAAPDEGEPSVETGADGTYRLDGIAPGPSRAVRVALRDGWDPAVAGGDVSRLYFYPGETRYTDFALKPRPATVTGDVFHDLDADGVRDPDEPALPGWTVYVDSVADGFYNAGEPSVLTDAAGDYTMQFRMGAHRVGARRMPGWEPTAPADAVRTFTVDAGQQVSGFSFGMRRAGTSGTVEGTVFRDVDGDGVREAEDVGWKNGIVFADPDDDGALDPGEYQTAPDAAGRYSLAVPAGVPQTIRIVWPVETSVYATAPRSASHVVTVAPDATASAVDFGLALGHSVGGSVYHELHGNGVRDSHERGLAGWRVEVRDATTGTGTDGALLAVATTGDDGRFDVHGLPLEVRRVLVTPLPPTGWRRLTSPRLIDFATWPPGATNDFGATDRSHVTGSVYHDTNRDGVFQIGRPGHNDTPLGGWTVYADADDDGVYDPGERVAVTFPNGSYSIPFLPARPEPYVIRVLTQPGFAPFGPPAGSFTLDLSTARVASGTHFGLADTGVAGRHVFYNNSTFDGGDASPTAADDAAIATDRRPLFPGETAGPRNVTNYSRGINGVMIDFLGDLPLTALAGIGAGVAFKAGPGGDPSGWADAPRLKQLAVRPGAGVDGSDRITFVWPDGVIRDRWLQVTVPAFPEWGLARPDVFYFGNLVGETGDAGSPLRVSALDLASVRRSTNQAAAITNPVDFNRDGRVNALDVAAARSNLRGSLGPVGPAAPVPTAGAAPALPGTPFRVWDEQPAGIL